jgi:uncharacterized membrane protein YkoI
MKLSTNQVRSSVRVLVALAAVSFSAAAMPRAIEAQRAPETGAPFAPEDPPTSFIAQRGSLSLAQATALAQSRYRGRVVRAEAVQQGGRTIYEIRILGDDGRVRTVRVDAETGAVM